MVSILLNEGHWLSKVIVVVDLSVIGAASVLLSGESTTFDAMSVTGFVGLGVAAVLLTESRVGACRRYEQKMHAYYD